MGTWQKIKSELRGAYQRTCNTVTNTVDAVKLKNRIAEQREILEKAELEIGQIICDIRRGATDAFPAQLLFKAEEIERIEQLFTVIRACEAEIETLETELSIVKARKNGPCAVPVTDEDSASETTETEA